jgi:hypothetical protein
MEVLRAFYARWYRIERARDELTHKEYVVMQIVLVVFCNGVVWFYARFLYALLRERPRHRLMPIRRRQSQANFAEKKATTGLSRVA